MRRLQYLEDGLEPYTGADDDPHNELMEVEQGPDGQMVPIPAGAVPEGIVGTYFPSDQPYSIVNPGLPPSYSRRSAVPDQSGDAKPFGDQADPDAWKPRPQVPPPPHGSQTPVLDHLSGMYDPKATEIDPKTGKTVNIGPPVMTKPKWWQTALAAGLGGGVGWVNAAGRVRPIDAGAATEGILHPGYQGRLEEWQSRVMPVAAQSQIEAQKAQMAQKAEMNAADIADKRAGAQYKIGAGRNGMMPVSEALAAGSQGRLKAGAWVPYQVWEREDELQHGRFGPKQPAVTVAEKFKELKEAFPHKTDDELWQAVVNPSMVGRPDPQEKNPNEWGLYLDANGGDPKKALAQWRADKAAMRAPTDPLAEELRRQRLEDARQKPLNDISKWKEDRERKIEQQRVQSIKALNNQTDLSSEDRDKQRAAINTKAISQLQSVQDEYTREWRAHGMSATDQDVQPDFTYKERSAAPAQATPPATAPPAAPPRTPPTSAQPQRPAPPAPKQSAAPAAKPPASQPTAAKPPAAATPQYTEGQVVTLPGSGNKVRIKGIDHKSGKVTTIPVYSLGDLINVGGKPHRVSKVDADGNALAATPVTQ